MFIRALAMLGMTVCACAAGPLTGIEFVNEFLAENQGEAAAVINLLFGPDANSPLVFARLVDPVALTFSYSLKPGTNYRGLSLKLSGSGTFDAMSNTWTVSSSGLLGTQAWTTAGHDIITDTTDYAYTSHEDSFDDNGIKTGDIEDNVSVDFFGRSHGVAHYTNPDGSRRGNDFNIDDFVFDDTWIWTMNGSSMGFNITSNANTPGTFTTVVSAVPEPSAFLPLLSGLAFFAWLYTYLVSHSRTEKARSKSAPRAGSLEPGRRALRTGQIRGGAGGSEPGPRSRSVRPGEFAKQTDSRGKTQTRTRTPKCAGSA